MEIIENFLKDKENQLKKICFDFYEEKSDLSFLSLKETVRPELEKALVVFKNKNNNNLFGIDNYFFTVIRNTLKKIKNEGKTIIPVCPNCKYEKEINYLKIIKGKYFCNKCYYKSQNSELKSEKYLYNTFSLFSLSGYRCNDCKRYIPEMQESIVKCPYQDCLFVGKKSDLKPARNPKIKGELDYKSTVKLKDDELGSVEENNEKQSPEFYINILFNIIDKELNNIPINNSSKMDRICMLNAYKNIIKLSPLEMIDYLIFLNKNSMQSFIFQDFIKNLENSIPFESKPGVKINSLEECNVFDGVSEFTAVVEKNGNISNNTKEIYVGGRSASYCKPFYIGKLISVEDEDGNSLLDKIKFYSFSSIKTNLEPGTKVFVKHFRIPPHYQMGAMVHLNRYRRKIVDEAFFQINGTQRKICK